MNELREIVAKALRSPLGDDRCLLTWDQEQEATQERWRAIADGWIRQFPKDIVRLAEDQALPPNPFTDKRRMIKDMNLGYTKCQQDMADFKRVVPLG